MNEPMMISSMRKRLERGENQEVRIVNSKGEPLVGTSIRTFLAEYDEAMQAEYERGHDEGYQSGYAGFGGF